MQSKDQPQDDDTYLIGLKKLKVSDQVIAAKLGWTVEHVKERWAAILSSAEAMHSNGYAELSQLYNMFAMQYQLFGQSLAQIACALDSPVSETQLADLIRGGGSTPEQIAAAILKHVIVLKKFELVEPEQLFAKAQAQ
jgi:hypothetical protein